MTTRMFSHVLCDFDGCRRPVQAKGLCAGHYYTPCLVSTSVAIVPGNATSGTIPGDVAAFICAARNNIDELCNLAEQAIAENANERS